MKKLIVLVCSLLLISACTAPSERNILPTNETETPSPSSPPESPKPPPVTVERWMEAYAGYLRKNIPISEVEFDSLVDYSDEKIRFSAFLAGGYPVTPFFYLYDIDNDKTPELIYIDPANGYDADVYAYGSNQVSKIGSIKFYPFGSLGISLDKTEGLYSDVGYKGHYGEIYLYTMNNGTLTEQMALEYNNQPELSPEHPGEPYSFEDFTLIDYYEVTEANISKAIYD